MRVNFKGKEYMLLQDAYLTGTNEKPYYTAVAMDNDGYKHDIIWYPVEDFEYLDDTGEHCDWEHPDDVRSL